MRADTKSDARVRNQHLAEIAVVVLVGAVPGDGALQTLLERDLGSTVVVVAITSKRLPSWHAPAVRRMGGTSTWRRTFRVRFFGRSCSTHSSHHYILRSHPPWQCRSSSRPSRARPSLSTSSLRTRSRTSRPKSRTRRVWNILEISGEFDSNVPHMCSFC